MDRWWPDGTESGSRLWQGVAAIVVLGCALGVAQNALVRSGSTSAGLSWRYAPPKLDDLDSLTKTAAGTEPKPDQPKPASQTPLPPDMNDPLGLATASAPGSLDVPDVPRPVQIQLTKVKEFFDANAATIVDARDPDEYAAGHIPGSLNLPYEQTVTDPAKLELFDPKGKPIIVYCGGGTCEISMNLGFALVAHGKHKVLVFTGGWPEWSQASYPVAKGPTPAGS